MHNTNLRSWWKGVARWGATLLAAMAATTNAVACAPRFREGVAGENPAEWSEQEHYERSIQYLLLPKIRGVGYDVPGRRIFFSACRRRQYACDLYFVNLDGPRNQEATCFRSSRQFGYEWPTIFSDGRQLVAVRTVRRERPSQRNVHHQLVQIDLRSGEERVIADAGEGRFDRVLYVGEDALLVVRSYRSSPSVRCRGDYCTDLADLITFYGGERRGGVITTRLLGRIDLVPLRAVDPVWLISVSPAAGDPDRHVRSYSLDAHARGGFRSIIPSQAGLGELLSEVAQSHDSFTGWRVEDLIFNGGGLMQLTPFCATPAAQAWEPQAVLVDAQHGAYLVKRVREPDITHAATLEIVALENRGSIPWRSVVEITATLPRSTND